MSWGHSPWPGESHKHDSAKESRQDLLSGPNGISLRSGERYLGIYQESCHLWGGHGEEHARTFYGDENVLCSN